MTQLTTYEQQQVQQIAGWKAEPPALVLEAMEVVTHPMVKLAERFIPKQAVKDAIEIAYKDSEILAHRDPVMQRGQVGDIHELRKGDMALCDRLADEFGLLASRSATIRGATVQAGAVAGMEMSIMYALKAVHTIGYCYGFAPEDPRERHWALQTLLLASAGSMEGKQNAILNFRCLEDVFIEELAEDFVEEQAAEAGEAAAEALVSGSIPFVGLALSSATNAATTYHTAHVAKRVFQERWLRANGKVDHIDPDPHFARSRLTRAESVLASCIYWPSYFVSFAASFPALFLASFLPKQNVAVRGFAEGGAAAAHDVRHIKHALGDAVAARSKAEPQPTASPVPA